MLRGVRYLLNDPRFFAAYFVGRPARVIKEVTGRSESDYFALRDELDSAVDFAAAMAETTVAVTGERFALTQDHYFLYALVRLLKPRLVVETGVFDGYYSACWLKGLRDNANDGRLISIDLPAELPVHESTDQIGRSTLPPGHGPGWVVPADLRPAWKLELGDSRALLPGVLRREGSVDIFFHDSLHTYEHMSFEYEAAWPHLAPDGLLMSHDIHWNRAFRHFQRRQQRPVAAFHGFGVIRRSASSVGTAGADVPEQTAM